MNRLAMIYGCDKMVTQWNVRLSWGSVLKDVILVECLFTQQNISSLHSWFYHLSFFLFAFPTRLAFGIFSMERSDSSDWTLKRWSHRTVTHFKIAYSWTVGPFPTLDQSSSKSNQEKILSPKISVPGHDLQLQMTLQFCSKEAEANNQQEVVRFGLHCYQGEEIVSEVTVFFALNFYLGSVSRPYGMDWVLHFR